MNRTRRHFASLLALIGIVFNVFGSSMVAAQAAQSGVPVVICTGTGLKTIIVDFSGKSTKDPATKSHCPFCSGPPEQVLPVVPATYPATVSLAVLTPGCPVAAADAERDAWTTPPSQAPPQLS
jgi:hypothetical protein